MSETIIELAAELRDLAKTVNRETHEAELSAYADKVNAWLDECRLRARERRERAEYTRDWREHLGLPHEGEKGEAA